MRLSDDRCEFIKGEVIHLFKRCRVCRIPIDGLVIARTKGIKLVQYSSLSCREQQEVNKFSEDGFFLENPNGTEVIYYNEAVQPERVNMTILHEIAHCVLDHTGAPEKAEEEEAEAAFFAKYAFAPPALVHQIAPKSWMEVRNVFRNSAEAALYSYEYYQKWLSGFSFYGYKEYEIELLSLFGVAPQKERKSPMVA